MNIDVMKWDFCPREFTVEAWFKNAKQSFKFQEFLTLSTCKVLFRQLPDIQVPGPCDQWHRIHIVCNRANCKIYIDGTETQRTIFRPLTPEEAFEQALENL